MPPHKCNKVKMEKIPMNQNLVNGHYQHIELVEVPESKMDNAHVDMLFDNNANTGSWKIAGMHPCFSKSGHLTALAVCVGQKALLIVDIKKFSESSHPKPPTSTRLYLQSKLLSKSSGFTTVAFNAHELALALHRNMGLASARVIDLLSLPPGKRDIVEIVKHVTRARVEQLELYEANVRDAFETAIFDKAERWTLVEMAWFASFLANESDVQNELVRIAVVDTTRFTKENLDILADGMRASLVGDLEKPTRETLNINSGAITYAGSKASYIQTNYGHRLSNSGHQTLKVTLEGNINLLGKVASTKGKKANLRIEKLEGISNPKIRSLTLVGKAHSSQSEKKKLETILLTLQQKLPLFDEYWTKLLFLTSEENSTADDGFTEDQPMPTGESPAINADDNTWSISTTTATNDKGNSWTQPLQPNIQEPVDSEHTDEDGLNSSQKAALENMLSDAPVSIIKGPPGTGKTTVIAAYLSKLESSGESAFVTANSNVAVRNIGEKLAKTGLSDWLLVVSDDFLVGWHEHHYQNIPHANFASLSALRAQPRRRFILCTLSMLNNSKFMSITKPIQARCLVVDEASQTPMSSYLPIIAKYGKKMKKMVFIGDDRQLPPYGSETSQALNSIFSHKKLLRSLDLKLLTIQYRMPPAIGNFISTFVYAGQLNTWDGHPIKSPLCVQFIHTDGQEEPVKTSFKNPSEASTAISVAKTLDKHKKSFKLITPYDTQRDLLEQKLKDHGIPWENKVFTVDSFQGNEEDFIIISLVRTRSVGFLHDLRRSNVMLSRAKRGMVICSNHCFLESAEAKGTLIGKMAEKWMEIEGGWIMNQDMLKEKLHIE